VSFASRSLKVIGLIARRYALEQFYNNKRNPDSLGDFTEPQLYSQLPTPATTFLECLFQKHCIDLIKQSSGSLWERLATCYINFSHFTEDIAHKDAYNSLTEEGLVSHFVRGCAIKCGQNQPGIDMVIPMAVLPSESALDKPVSRSEISALIIQVKNVRDDKESFTVESLDKAQFDIRHISGLSGRKENIFYVGLWMSLRDPRNLVRVLPQRSEGTLAPSTPS